MKQIRGTWVTCVASIWIAATVQIPRAAAQTTVRTSADAAIYTFDPSDKSKFAWHWNGTRARTIYNPLDGGILLTYAMPATETAFPSDGCTNGDAAWRRMLIDACLAHDAAYSAPFDKGNFLKYKSGVSIGKTKGQASGKIAPTWFTAVQNFGGFRGNKTASISEQGGVFAVKNKGAYHLSCRVKWNDPKKVAREVLVGKDAGLRALVVPISSKATNIDAECWAEGGTQIFRKTFPGPGSTVNQGFTVWGTTLNHNFNEVLED